MSKELDIIPSKITLAPHMPHIRLVKECGQKVGGKCLTVNHYKLHCTVPIGDLMGRYYTKVEVADENGTIAEDGVREFRIVLTLKSSSGEAGYVHEVFEIPGNINPGEVKCRVNVEEGVGPDNTATATAAYADADED